MKILNRFTRETIIERDVETIKELVEIAIKEKADLSEANLWKADLSEANLREADLWKADLSEANLSEANLWKADLSEANLSEANLWKADLSEANLWKANLWKADLNCIYYKTKVTEKQKEQITESDLFEVLE